MEIFWDKYNAFRSHHKDKSFIDIFIKLLVGAWRIVLAKWYLKNCTIVGSFVSVNGKPVIKNFGSIFIEDDVRVWSSIVKTQIYVSKDAVLKVGKNSRLNGVHIDVRNQIVIGKNVRISPYVIIMESDEHTIEDHFASDVPQPIFIDDDVWLATRCTILKGVHIGKGAVVAAGAVVTRNVPEYTVVGGVPARIIKHINVLSSPQVL